MEERNEITDSRIIRIAITGPESTGKSALAGELARHYKTCYVREAARRYIAKLNRPYTYDDLQRIARMQVSAEKYSMKKAEGYLFMDTELIVMKIWFLNSYAMCPKWVLKKSEEIKYDLYLLCDIDLPWEPDPQREHPDRREYFFNKYHEELASRNLPFVIISGAGKQRTQNAIDAIESLG
jgi:NadR type nicotinamide-nucleotide adenylyltransferase